MSKLLFDEHPLVVNVSLAQAIGLNEAIILQQVHYWAEINKKVNRNLKDGHYWTFNTYAEWQKQFPFFSARTIQRTMLDLEKAGYLISGKYNKLGIDRTKWYRVDYKKLDKPNELPSCQNGTMDDAKLARPLPETNVPETNTRKKEKERRELRTPLALPYTFSNYLKNFEQDNMEAIEAVRQYLYAFRQYRGKEHPRLKPGQWDTVCSTMMYAYDPDTDKSFDVSLDDLEKMVEQHFKTKYQAGCNYSILHFCEDGVKIRRMYEVAY